MKVYFDGIIYSWQKTGGIVRYFNELMPRVAAADNTEAELVLREPHFNSYPKTAKLRARAVKHYPFVNGAVSLKYFRKILSPVNKYFMGRYFGGVRQGVFHSTYYTTYKSLRVPQVLTVHDMIYEKLPAFFSDSASRRFVRNKKACIDAADSIICISEATKKDLLSIYNIPGNKVSVVHLGLSKSFYMVGDEGLKRCFLKEKNINRPYLLFVGHRLTYKNFIFFINTYAKWKNRGDFLLVLAGGFPFSGSESKLIHSLGLSGSVMRFERVSEEDLVLFYNCAQGFVFPSLYEGFGLPLVEALACGVKVLASDIPAFREIAGSLPVYFNPEDEGSLLGGLDAMITIGSRQDAAIISDKVKAKYNWDNTAGQILDVYRSLG